MKRSLIAVLILILLVLALPAVAASVEPQVVDGNPNCTALGYAFGFKPQPEPPPSGTYSIDGINTVTITSDGVNFDWSSTLGMDAVISKGGSNANVYVYSPESMGDTGLHSPINPNNGNPFGLSHIEFCYDYELAVSKTANTYYVRTYTWIIDKSVDDNSHTGFVGDSFQSNYNVSVDQTVNDTDHRIYGNITITNPAPFTVNISVADSIDNIGAVTTDCPASVGAGSTVVCSYSVNSGGQVGTLNTVNVTSSVEGVAGGQATAGIIWGGPSTIVGSPSVNVSDTVQGPLGNTSGDQNYHYPRNFACPTDITRYFNGVYTENFPNTASIDTNPQQSDSELVTLTCYAPVASKTALTAYDRDWTWTIDKSADQTSLTLATGQVWTVNYNVSVNASSDDSNFVVSGVIQVQNPNPSQAMNVSVSDMVGTTPATVDCGNGQTNVSIPASALLTCIYSADLGDGDKPADGVNTATVILNGIYPFSATANYSFGTPTNETDECVAVTDTLGGTLGTVCASDLVKSFSYSYTVGPYATCGNYTVDNTVVAKANDSGDEVNDTVSIPIHVPCGGCTLTQGYWRTHSLRGPAPYDDAWLLVGPAGSDTTFFATGKTYYEILWLPVAGDPYLILAKQYIAAKLNVLNGADATVLGMSLTQAEALLTQYNLGNVPANKRGQFTSLAGTLDSYNNGLTGPAHCSE